MKIVVCLRQGADGEINPFDASAYECALEIPGSEVTLLSMGPSKTENLLARQTRLGAERAILLSDSSFAGADTLATAYTLSLAIKKLSPDLVICGRQTLVGDTGQTGLMLAQMIGYSLAANVIEVIAAEDHIITCRTRSEAEKSISLPALITLERGYVLRFPSLSSKVGKVERWTADDIDADVERCGLKGSPTRVIHTFENEYGKRKCTFISRSDLDKAVKHGLKKNANSIIQENICTEKLKKVISVTDAPISFARTVSNDTTVIALTDAERLAVTIKQTDPDAVLFGSDEKSKIVAASVAAILGLGLCADCTALGCENGELIMYRPALSGSIIAKIKSLTRPAMATVRTENNSTDNNIIVCAGYGVRNDLDRVRAFAQTLGASFAVTRKLVDSGLATYEDQVGLTGKTVSPPVYIAVGLSGAVQHIVGMRRAGTVIAINPDKNAPVFDYSDFGIIEKF